MKKLTITSLIVLTAALTLLACKKEIIQENIYLNETILQTLETYERDGRYPYSWTNDYDGVSQDLNYQSCTIANAKSDSSHSTFCCGITLEVYFKSIMSTLNESENLNGIKAKDFDKFIRKWFVLEANGDGPGLALKAYGLGKSIDKMKDVLPGDFVQIWRTNGSGHSVIFIEWLTNDDSDTTGMKYWSTQTSTHGVNYNNEYFKDFGGKIDKNVTHYSRAFKPKYFIKK